MTTLDGRSGVAAGPTVERRPEPLGRQKRPCVECPFRVDVAPGQFPMERFEALRSTAATANGESAPLDAPMFACHKSPDGGEFACAGWLAVEGRNHVGVRVACAFGRLPAEALDPADDWPELFPDYAAMLAHQESS